MKPEDLAGVSVHDFRENWLDGAQYELLTRTWLARTPVKGVEVGFQTRTGPRYALLSVHQPPNADEDLVVMLDITERRVLMAHSAAEAVALAGSHAGQIDLLLTDVVMPGASGCDLARRVREALTNQ